MNFMLTSHSMKNVIMPFLITISFLCQLKAAPLSDELVQLHNVTTAEMNAISSPVQGSLVFNTDDKEVYERNATAWNRISSIGSETKIVTGDCIEIIGNGTASTPYHLTHYTPGKTQVTAGETCKALFDTNCTPYDGMFWIDPNGGSTNDAFKVFCNMTTDGGGWTKVPYASDLIKQQQFGASSDQWRWLPNDFTFILTNTQINNIRSKSTESKQRYVGICDGVRLPLINIETQDNGGTREYFGSFLTQNPAWFR